MSLKRRAWGQQMLLPLLIREGSLGSGLRVGLEVPGTMLLSEPRPR